MIGMKKMQLFTQLHLSEQSWQRTAEHCSIYLSSKVATQLRISLNKTHYYTNGFYDSALNGALITAATTFFFVGHRVSEHHHSIY